MTNNRYLYITHVCPYYCPERILFFFGTIRLMQKKYRVKAKKLAKAEKTYCKSKKKDLNRIKQNMRNFRAVLYTKNVSATLIINCDMP